MIQILKLLLSVTVLVPILNSAPLSKDYEGLRLIQMDEAQPPEWMTDAEVRTTRDLHIHT